MAILFLLAGFTALSSFLVYVRGRKYAQVYPGELPPRPTYREALNFLLHQCYLLFFIWVGLSTGSVSLAEIGIKTVVPVWASLAAGLGLYLIYVASGMLTGHLLGPNEKMQDAAYLAMRQL